MTNKEIGLKKVNELVNRFKEHHVLYKKSDYNETQTRRDFIDPFFKALGWDIDNELGHAESYREVIHEDKLKISGGTKAPDYSFRLSGKEKLFFLEAKKPFVKVKDDVDPSYQIKRYGWNAKMTVSVLTDFEELSIYDCTKEPKPNDNPHKSRLNYLTYEQYEKEWDFLWDVLSKEAATSGKFSDFIKKVPQKKGTDTVDKKFLKSLDEWRTLLAETISKENKQLDEEELNFVVQQTLDRIIFLRICEDRSIEPYGRLKECLSRGEYYKNLLLEFKQADEKFNSGLFNFKKDKLSQSINISNKTVKTIISQLYYPECPYEFSVLSVEILGSAYEQFLGKTITINNKGKALIELKPEVRKAGGVYYTPQYIVDYIVTNTIGKLCANKTPKDVAEIKIVDPACGSGSFLLGAYQYLLDWHKDYYLQYPSKKNPITPDGNLTTKEKKKILLNNIYGVDIDTNASEVTKLSLLLKCMEGETQASIVHQIKMFNDRVLPTLDENIKSGNSLIDTDYYDSEFDFGEERKIKPFSWQKAFPDIFKRGGFDVVIGNPPYIDSEEMTKTNIPLRNYANSRYETAKGNWDMYCIYTEKALKLLKSNGNFGFIIPNKFLSAPYGLHLKKYLSKYQIINVEDYSSVSVFVSDRKINVYPIILIIAKNEKENNGVYSKYKEINSNITRIYEKPYNIKQGELDWTAKFSSGNNLINKVLNKSDKIKYHFDIHNSATVSEAYLIKDILVDNNSEKNIRLINTGTIDRYSNLWGISKTQYIKNSYLYPSIDRKKFFDCLPNRIDVTKQKKIILAGMVKYLEGTIVNEKYYSAKSTTIIINKESNSISLEYLLGLLNSKLYSYIYKEINKHNAMSGGFMNVSKKQLDDFIFYNCKDHSDKVKYEKIINHVKQLLELYQEFHITSLDSKKEQIKGKIEYNEDKIDEIIYELYGLTKEEIELIE
jgi:hypothetical protein